MIQFHPYANLLPEMSEDEFAELRDDIHRNGLLQPIIRDESGAVLDGRHRLRACESVGIEPQFETFSGGDPEKLNLIVSRNLCRRHLTNGQKALLAAKLRPIYDKAAEGRKKSKLKRGVHPPDPENLPAPSGDARDQVGAQFGVSGRTVDFARRVLEKGCPELIRLVEVGEIAVSAAAEIALLPLSEQISVLKSEATSVHTVAAFGRRTRRPKKRRPKVPASSKRQKVAAKATGDCMSQSSIETSCLSDHQSEGDLYERSHRFIASARTCSPAFDEIILHSLTSFTDIQYAHVPQNLDEAVLFCRVTLDRFLPQHDSCDAGATRARCSNLADNVAKLKSAIAEMTFGSRHEEIQILARLSNMLLKMCDDDAA